MLNGCLVKNKHFPGLLLAATTIALIYMNYLDCDSITVKENLTRITIVFYYKYNCDIFVYPLSDTSRWVKILISFCNFNNTIVDNNVYFARNTDNAYGVTENRYYV